MLKIEDYWGLQGNLLSGGGGVSGWTNALQYTANTQETIQFVRVTKQAEMKSDGSDIRFVKDISGSGKDLFFLPYEYLTSDATYHYFKVSHRNYFSTASSTFYALYGNPSAVSESSPYRMALEGGWTVNYFDRGPNYDVANTFRAWDTLFDGPGDASQEVNWPAASQLPFHQTAWGKPQSSDYDHIFLAYKYDAIDNIHAGSPTSKSAIRVTHDFGASWSSRSYIYDPDEGYITTSTDSKAIPTSHPTSVSFNVAETDRLWQVGDIARVKATAGTGGTNYFWMQITSYSGGVLQGDSLSHSGTGTFSDWAISQRFGATNTCITTVKLPSGTVRLVAEYTLYDFYNAILRVYSRYTDLNSNYDITTWSSPVMISDDSWANVGGQACTTHDGLICMPYHENAIDTPDYSSSVAYSRDYGVTWDRIRTVASGSDLLDETDLRPLKDANGEWTNTILAVCRNEYAAGGYHQMKYYIDWTGSTFTSRDISENNWYDADGTVSRYTSVRCPDDTIIYAGGDQKGKMIVSRDECETHFPIPFNVLTTSGVSARRVYSVMAVHVDGRMLHFWASNKQPNGSDLYINYFDWTLNNFYVDTINTLTDGNGTHNRPRNLNPGMRIGEFLEGYRGATTSSILVPTATGQQRTFSIQTGHAIQPGDFIPFVYTNNNGVRFILQCDSYNSLTGEFTGTCTSFNGSGTQSTWQYNLGSADNTGNLLANQAYLEVPKLYNNNGQIRPCQVLFDMGSFGSGLVTGGFWGVKKFETRATAVITISNAGSDGDTIQIDWSKSGTFTGLFGGIKNVAKYTVQSGDSIADVVSGLVADANQKGICPVVASDATTLTLMAPRGMNTAINTQSFGVVVTGTVAGSSGTFSGGAAIEASTALQNVITFDNANNIVRIEQANDNHNQALTIVDSPTGDDTMNWDSSEVDITHNATTRTKGPATGSGVPNFEAQGIMFLTTSPSSVQGLLDVRKYIRQPHGDNQTIPTEGGITTGTWTERTDGRGIAA